MSQWYFCPAEYTTKTKSPKTNPEQVFLGWELELGLGFVLEGVLHWQKYNWLILGSGREGGREGREGEGGREGGREGGKEGRKEGGRNEGEGGEILKLA